MWQEDRASRNRRASDRNEASGKVGAIAALFECERLLIAAAALACFQLGNGAMLPFYGLAVVSVKQGTRPDLSCAPSLWHKAPPPM
jgi:hypothetical protein